MDDKRLIDKDKLIKKIRAEIDTWAKSRMCMTADELLETIEEFEEEAQPVKQRWIEENSVSEGYLQDWYISSVDNTETPVWTVEHIEELCHDFWLFPKTRLDGAEKENDYVDD